MSGFEALRCLSGLLLLVLVCQAHALEWQDQAPIAQLFASAGVSGTFVVFDPVTQRHIGHDRERAATRFVPASSFKIAHSLIALQTGAVSDTEEVLAWDGQPRPFASWEQDMTMREAIRASNASAYQGIARRIGLEPMRRYLALLEYGNQQTGERVDAFWLLGPLQISALEQVRFVARLARSELPIAQPVQEQVRDILRVEQNGAWTLYAKTGWQNAPDPGIGWWVGWVQNAEQVRAFALNIDIRAADDAPLRIQLGKASLAILGLWPEPAQSLNAAKEK